MKRAVEVQAHESCVVAGTRTRRDPLPAVSPELQLKFQDSGSTVTNWVRIRCIEGPTTYTNKAYGLRQRAQKDGEKGGRGPGAGGPGKVARSTRVFFKKACE